ncbi:hypothetical protein KOW79_011387 [Hemibagrus wyckioides]|uniref:Uncharacterized protein n=1 Tax=Hemibagrus wyckioides TaxID=337641 RepID=A0A9D3SHX8_9TELE|nr:hypothetical protein KOW79_011387 [Hemibagrus wyckioides]
MLGVTKPGLDAGLLNGRVGLTSDGEKARFILDVGLYSVQSNLNFRANRRKVDNTPCSDYFFNSPTEWTLHKGCGVLGEHGAV